MGKSPSQRRHPRSTLRAQAHASAHGDDSAGGEVIQHSLVPRNQPDLVTTQSALEQLVQTLVDAGQFAYDSEFIGELSYVPRLCLIQVATADAVTLIDPMADLDLTPFWELICDPAVEKIVHAGEQDIEPVFRHLNGSLPANIFDTQIAAGFAAITYPVSLSRLVDEMLGVRLAKGFTFTAWDQRPLSRAQLRYAADDVRYLPAVRQILHERLEARGHVQLAQQACAALLEPTVYTASADGNYMRVRGAGGLDPRNLAVLRELAIWRDRTARDEDVPPRTLVRDEVLLSMARQPIKSVEQLDRVKGLPRPVESRYGKELLAATQRGLAIPAGELPVVKNHEETAAEKFATDALLVEIQRHCYRHGIDPALITSRQEVSEVRRRWAAGESPDELRLMRGWRRDVAGDFAIACLEGGE